MEEQLSHFSAESQALIRHILEHARELDAMIPNHHRIYVDKDGFMAKSPTFEHKLSDWLKECNNRRQFYEAEELREWLKAQRDVQLKELKSDILDTYQKPYRAYLKGLLALIKNEIGETAGEKKELAGQQQVMDALKAGELEDALELLENWLKGKADEASLRREAILLRASWEDLQMQMRQDLLAPAEARREKARLRMAILELLEEGGE
jgi:hypothetical protein